VALRWTSKAHADLARLQEKRYELAGTDIFVLRIFHTREDR
jgi:hypothetical protein